MYQLWEAKIDGGNGKELYGEDFADIWAINRIHFKAGMNKDCDHVSRLWYPPGSCGWLSMVAIQSTARSALAYRSTLISAGSTACDSNAEHRQLSRFCFFVR